MAEAPALCTLYLGSAGMIWALSELGSSIGKDVLAGVIDCGEPEPAATSLHQLTQPCLQARNAFRQRLLRQRQRLRRTPEVLVVDDGDERPELCQVEIHPESLPQPVVVVSAQEMLDERR
jgi:hypothetical protein